MRNRKVEKWLCRCKAVLLAIGILLCFGAVDAYADTNGGTVKLDGTEYKGTTTYGNNIYYYFDLAKAGEVVLRLSRDTVGSDHLVLKLVDRNDGDKVLQSGQGYLDVVLPQGSYAAVVYWTDCDDVPVPIDYTFTAELRDKSFPSNISVSTATEMVPLQTYSETLSDTMGIKCYYKITVPQESMVLLQNPGAGFISRLYADAQLTTQIGKNMSGTFNSTYSYFTLQKGVYYLCVQSDTSGLYPYSIVMDLVKKPEKLNTTGTVDELGRAYLTWTHTKSTRSYRIYKKTGTEWKLIDSTVPMECNRYDGNIITNGNQYAYRGSVIEKGGKQEYAVVAVDSPALDTSHEFHYTEMMIAGDIRENAVTISRDVTEPNGNNTGKVSLSKPVLKKLTNKQGRKLSVQWKKYTKAVSIQVQYSTSKKFTAKTTKTKTVKASKTSVTVKSLKKNKTYYVRVRAVKGSSKSKWSSVKKIRIRK